MPDLQKSIESLRDEARRRGLDMLTYLLDMAAIEAAQHRRYQEPDAVEPIEDQPG